MAKGAIATEFRRNQKVRTLDDLPGVPQGTQGRVDSITGLTWIRYHVAFDNGVNLGSVDSRYLALAKQYDAALRARVEAANAVEVAEVTDNGSEDAAAASGDEGGDKTVNGVTVPGHLLERSSLARSRLAG